jgi:hypothetical protein
MWLLRWSMVDPDIFVACFTANLQDLLVYVI